VRAITPAEPKRLLPRTQEDEDDMEPLITLLAATLIGWGVTSLRLGRPSGWEVPLRVGIFAMFLLTGIVHFVGMRAEMVEMVPAGIPHPELIVTVTGILELAGAFGMLIRPLVPWAAGGLTLLLLALFPANVSLALSDADLAWWDELLPRGITQLVFLAATISLLVLALRPSKKRESQVGDTSRGAHA